MINQAGRKEYSMDIILQLKEELKVEKWQVEAAVKLIDEGNTLSLIHICP